MSTFLEHARHNKKAFDYLNSASIYPDWTITTAFYCAMHYSYAILFPLSENGATYRNIEEYYNANKRPNGGDSKHGMTLKLVRRYHPTIGEKYKTLKDVAHTSRYHDYNLPNAVVAMVRRNLQVIESYCEGFYTSKTLPPSSTT
jgi:hypothetical protein